MSTSPSSVVAVSNDALRPELLDRLFVDDNDYDVIVVESIERAYSRIRQVQPDAVVVFMNIDDVDACQLLSMLHIDHELRGMSVVSCTTSPDAGATHHLGDFEERCDTCDTRQAGGELNIRYADDEAPARGTLFAPVRAARSRCRRRARSARRVVPSQSPPARACPAARSGRACCRAIVSASIPFPSSRITSAKLPRLVMDRDDDLPRLRVLDRVAQRLAGDAIRFVADDRIEIARFAVDVDVDRRRIDADRSLVSSAPTAAMPFARSFSVVADARKPCTALRPSVIAASA